MRCQARFSRLLVAAALLTMMGAPVLLRAQGPPAQNSGAPERGVARISVMNGQVSVRRGDSGEWVAGIINAPLMVDDRVAAGQSSRAEVQFDSANLIRVGANAEIRLGALDYNHYNIQIAHGTVTYRVLRDSRVKVELDTPLISVRPMHIGVYRVYVQQDGQTEITVRLGDAEIYTPRGVEQLQAGQTMLARGTAADPEFRVVPAIAIDEWDRWNEQRDHELLSSQSYRNVPRDVYGTEGMDSSGRWVNDPTYGSVWSPTVGPDWAPYQDGRWVWEDWYGWTWVSYEPWGWAPYHYGRWFYGAPYGWCWYPGGFGPQYWSPALVAFFGFGGGGVGIGFGFGNVGWVALAPFEVMHPWWGPGFYGGFRGGVGVGVGITNANILASYRNARVANGVAGVSAADFAAGRFHNISRVGGEQIRNAGLVRGQLPVAPTSASLRYSNRAVTNVPRSSDNVRFFSHNQAAPVQHVPFAEQQRAMQQLSRQSAGTAAASTGSWRRYEGASSSSAGEARAGLPSNSTRPSGGAQSAPGRDSNGWQRFGEPRAAMNGGSGYGAARPNTVQPGGSSYRPYSAPATNYGSRSSGPQAMRIAPSVVHERSEPKTETHSTTHSSSGGGSGSSHVSHSSGGGGGGGGGGAHGGGHR
jgi:hypothetical protein